MAAGGVGSTPRRALRQGKLTTFGGRSETSRVTSADQKHAPGKTAQTARANAWQPPLEPPRAKKGCEARLPAIRRRKSLVDWGRRGSESLRMSRWTRRAGRLQHHRTLAIGCHDETKFRVGACKSLLCGGCIGCIPTRCPGRLSQRHQPFAF